MSSMKIYLTEIWQNNLLLQLIIGCILHICLVAKETSYEEKEMAYFLICSVKTYLKDPNNQLWLPTEKKKCCKINAQFELTGIWCDSVV